MKIDILIKKIIPPNDRENREGFSNQHLLDALTSDEREKVVEILIEKIDAESYDRCDPLIIDSFAYLKSEKALPTLRNLLKVDMYSVSKLAVIIAIYQITNEKNMINLAIEMIKKIDDRTDINYIYKLVDSFYYLAKFNEKKAWRLLSEYTFHSEYLISYNAKRILNYYISKN